MSPRVIFIVLGLLVCPVVSGSAKTISKTLNVRATVVDHCLLTSATQTQLSTYASDSTTSSNYNMLCNLETPYDLTINDEEGQLISTQVVDDDGFGYQYNVEKKEDGTYVVETCDSLAEIPGSPLETKNIQSQSGMEQSTQNPDGSITVNVNW